MRRTAIVAVAAGLLASGAAYAQSSEHPTSEHSTSKHSASHSASTAANPNAPQNSAIKDPHDNRAGAPAAGRNSFTLGQAREHIAKEGFTKVTGLTKSRDGIWRGRAMKDGRRVRVAMDFQGNVTGR